jgi:hypothetical protein
MIVSYLESCSWEATRIPAQGILVALLEREVTGEGKWVHTSLLEAMLSMLDFQASHWLMAGEMAPQVGNNCPTEIPTGVFETKDEHINIAAQHRRQWQRDLRALLPCYRAPRSDHRSPFRDFQSPVPEPSHHYGSAHASNPPEDQCQVDHHPQRRWRALWSDLSDIPHHSHVIE